MKGDFTRDTFRPERRYSSVRMQQGRVQLDADWNEAEDIHLGRERTEVRDIVGPCGAPIDNAGFAITLKEKDFVIGEGRLYVRGVLAENPAAVTFLTQPDYPIDKLPDPIVFGGSGPQDPTGGQVPGASSAYLFYLDVWEEHVTALEDGLLREVALNGPDTATRLRVVWQVTALSLPATVRTCAAAMALLPGATDARLIAKAKSLDDTEACTVKPGSSYKRLENQLYRVEVQQSGDLKSATFKWSRDNGSVVSGFTVVDARTLAMEQIGRDSVLSFQAGGWIEITDRKRELLGQPGTFFRVAKIEGNRLLLDPSQPGIVAADFGAGKKARRWDSLGAIPFDGLTPEGFLNLEDGVQIALSGNDFRSGDYWLIPARTVTGDVEWPFATPQPPRGIVHRRCPLAIATATTAKPGGWDVVDCRNPFVPLADVIGLFYGGGDGQTAIRNANGAPALAQAPTVGVARGKRPVAGAKVLWTVLKGGGSIAGPSILQTGPDGLVSCPWNLGVEDDLQQVRADLLDSEGVPTHIPIVFTATLPRASDGAAGCCRSIGVGGDYDSIKEAITDLVFKQGQSGICLCLMAGQHEWPDKIDGEPPKGLVNITITGIGDASVMIASGGFKLQDVPTLTLHFSDLAIRATSFQLSNLAEIGFREVTLILRPGDKEDGAGFTVEQAGVVRFEDCRIGSEGPLSFEDVTTLALENTTVIAVVSTGHAISVQGGGGRVSVTGCLLNSRIQGTFGATLEVSGVGTVHIERNEISARRGVTPGRIAGDQPATTTSTAPAAAAPAATTVSATMPKLIGGLVQRLGGNLTTAAATTEAKKLIGDSTDARTANAAALNTFVADQAMSIGRDGTAGMKAVATTLADPKSDVTAVAGALSALNNSVNDARSDTGVLAVSETLGIVLQLDASGDCHVVGNTLRGTVALYGDPGAKRINADQAKQYQNRIRQQGYSLWGTGNLFFSQNIVGPILLAASFVDGGDFKSFMEKGNVTTSVFLNAAISDNCFTAPPLELFVGKLSFTSNAFPAINLFNGLVVARNASYVGNTSDEEAGITSATAGQGIAANVRVDIF